MSGTTTRRIPRWLARMPIPWYRHGFGWLLGTRTAMLEHRGRRSGLARYVVLEVLDRDDSSFVVASGYGAASQWFQNVRADPEVRVWIGAVRAAPARTEILGVEEVRVRLDRYRRQRPRSAAALGRVLAIPELVGGGPLPDDVGRRLPLVLVRY